MIKCVNCGRKLQNEDKVWQVRLIDGQGIETYAPACCHACAATAQVNSAELHRMRMKSIQNQSYQIMSVHQYKEQNHKKSSDTQRAASEKIMGEVIHDFLHQKE